MSKTKKKVVKKKVVKKKVTKKDNSLGLGKVEKITTDKNEIEVSLSEDETELFVKFIEPKTGKLQIIAIIVVIVCLINILFSWF